MQAPRHRPVGVTILAALAGIGFIVNAFVTLLFVGALPALLFGGTGFFGQALLGAMLWGIMALIWGWVSISLWNLEAQGWLFVVILSILNLILAGLALIGASTIQALLPSIVVNGIILIYALSPGVKEAFGNPDQHV